MSRSVKKSVLSLIRSHNCLGSRWLIGGINAIVHSLSIVVTQLKRAVSI